MGSKTSIPWTDATWSPVSGCSHSGSPGCDACYARTIATRFKGSKAFPNGFDVTLHPERMTIPLHWKRPRKIFVCSMGDLFHDKVPDDFIERVFGIMALCQQHTFQLLSKRPERMLRWFNRTIPLSDVPTEVAGWAAQLGNIVWDARGSDLNNYLNVPGFKWGSEKNRRAWVGWPLPNVWIGVTAEKQEMAEKRIPKLLSTPAVKRFVSIEPMLGMVDLRNLHASNGALIDCLCGDVKTPNGTEVYAACPSALDQVIVGGETGPNARPTHPLWARKVRDDCRDTGTAFFFKSWGEWLPDSQVDRENPLHWSQFATARFGSLGSDGQWRSGTYSRLYKMPDIECMYRLGAKAAGHLLGGDEYHEFPK